MGRGFCAASSLRCRRDWSVRSGWWACLIDGVERLGVLLSGSCRI